MIIAIVVTVILSLLAFMFALECVLGLRPLLAPALPADDPPPFAVIVPAHDEELGIAATVTAIRRQLGPDDRLIVVADNCADNTAEQARAAGATVVERHDLTHRGKGYALAFGRDELAADPPTVVIVLDADCAPAPGSLVHLAVTAYKKNAAVQAANLMEVPSDLNPMVAISSFAFLVRNLIRQRGLMRLGGAPPLQGTGMAFPWAIFAGAPLATSDIVEDLNLGIALLRRGFRIVWTEAAQVRSPPGTSRATITQRTRWEHGSITSAIASAPLLIGSASRQRRIDMALLTLDLLIPPLALLVFLSSFAWLVAGFLAFVGQGMLPFAIQSVGLAAILIAVLVAWASNGRHLLPIQTLLRAPLYILWKMPIYARLLTKREKLWVRTARK